MIIVTHIALLHIFGIFSRGHMISELTGMDATKTGLLNGLGEMERRSPFSTKCLHLAIWVIINVSCHPLQVHCTCSPVPMRIGAARTFPTKLSTGYPQFQGLTNPDNKRVGGLVES